MPAVLEGLIQMTPRYIGFPYAVVEQAQIKMQFAVMSGFPNVIGAIDCTHVAIKAPSENEYAFVNRKQYHSINMQIICDADTILLNVVARWPGTTHNSFILRQSNVGRRLQTGAVQDGWLLGKPLYVCVFFFFIITFIWGGFLTVIYNAIFTQGIGGVR